MKQEIFTLNIIDITNDEGIDNMQLSQDYETFEQAYKDAVGYLLDERDNRNVINVFIMGGEYKNDNGDITGEPECIFCLSNKGKEETKIARADCGYVSLVVDEYINGI